MITAFLTFLFFFAIVGCVLYGRRLIKTEKVDAVFGNPERAKGGVHWVIVGSSFLLLVWLYYSWDIAKSFFPKSANELCQVGKVNESLLSLKYLFPINERQFKSTSTIQTETENLNRNAFSKLRQKNCDLIVVNDISKKDSGLNSDYNRVSIIDNSGKIKVIKKNRKSFIANAIAEIVLDKLLINDRRFN